MASEKQINYIHSLAEKRDLRMLDESIMAMINTPLYLEHANNAQVNDILDALKAQPWKPRNTGSAADEKSELQQLEDQVGKGRYFVTDPTDNTEKFFKVDKPDENSRWHGYTFLHVQASDFFHPIKSPQHKVAVYKAILTDPVNAMNEYGIRLGVCGLCGRTLTARDSRLRGIGPICADKIFMDNPANQATDEQLDLLDRLGLRRKED